MTTINTNIPVLLREGTSQSERTPAALAENYFQIDERDTADLLKFAREYASQVQFYDADNIPDGDWEAFFKNDAMLSALLAKQDVVGLRQGFDELIVEMVGVDGTDPGNKNEWRNTLQYLIDLISELDAWLLEASATEPLYKEIHQNIAVHGTLLAAKLYRYDLVAIDAFSVGTATLTQFDWDSLSPIWGVDTSVPIGGNEELELYGALGDPQKTKILVALPGVRAIYEGLQVSRESLIRVGGVEFNRQLTERSDHAPHFGLFLGFLQLLSFVRADFNSLSLRQQELYLREVLELAEHTSIPDKVHLLIALAGKVQNKLFEAGTAFAAGEDDLGNPVTYTLDRDTVINRAWVDDIHTFFVDRNNTDKVLRLSSLPYPTQELKEDLPPGSSIPAIGPFGETQYSATGTLVDEPTMTAVRIGFAVASPILWLEEGTRKINLTLTMPSGYHAGIDLAANLPANLRNGLQFEISGADGWVPLHWQAQNSVTYTAPGDGSGGARTLVFRLQLEPGDPAAVHYDPSVLGPEIQTQWPVIRAIVKENYLHVVDRLQAIQFQKYSIDVDVTGVKNLLFANNDTATFPETSNVSPWGSDPLSGTDFYIGSAEVFSKKLTSFNVEIDWSGVPGKYFDEYYDNYRWLEHIDYRAHLANLRTYQATGSCFPGRYWFQFVDQHNDIEPLYVEHWYSLNPLIFDNEYFTMRPAMLIDGSWYPLHYYDETQVLPEVISQSFTNSPQSDIVSLQPIIPTQGNSHAESQERYIAPVGTNLTKTQTSLTKSPPLPTESPISTDTYKSVAKNVVLQQSATTDQKAAFSGNGTDDQGEVGPGDGGSQDSASGGAGPGAGTEESDDGPQSDLCPVIYPSAYHPSPRTFDRYSLPIFDKSDARNARTYEFTHAYEGQNYDQTKAFERHPELRTLNGFQPGLSNNGFIRLELSSSFLQWVYTARQAESAKVIPSATPVRPTDDGNMPASAANVTFAGPREFPMYETFLYHLRTNPLNPPYIPAFNELSISYSSSVEAEMIIEFDNSLSETARNFAAGVALRDDWNQRIEQFFHIHPTGVVETAPVNNYSGASGNARLYLYNKLPDLQLTNTICANLAVYNPLEITEANKSDLARSIIAGNLFVALRDTQLPQTVDILFQFKEGTGNVSSDYPEVRWSYLAYNKWHTIAPDYISVDETQGMTQSGVIQLNLPAIDFSQNTIFSSGLCWLKATAIRQNHNDANQDIKWDAFDDLVGVHAQALTLSFVDNGNDPQFLANALPPETLDEFAVLDREILSGRQLYKSFGGRMAEDKAIFATRAGERLRHKQRGITSWDIERLTLETFPDLFKVRCVNHATLAGAYEPGNILVVVIPDTKNVNFDSPFQPKLPKTRLSAIEVFLDNHTAQQAQIEVVNPLYEAVQVELQVAFRPGFDFQFYRKELDIAIQQFISPWAFGLEETISFLFEITPSVLIAYIESLEYVDGVGTLTFTKTTASGVETYSTDSTVYATNAQAALVSAEGHSITKLEPANCA